jgi:hypothetical protein
VLLAIASLDLGVVRDTALRAALAARVIFRGSVPVWLGILQNCDETHRTGYGSASYQGDSRSPFGTWTRRESMIDTCKGKRLQVLDGGAGGPYIELTVNQLSEVRKLLDRNEIPYWVDSVAISIDGKPAVTVINLGFDIDVAQVQAILDVAA